MGRPPTPTQLKLVRGTTRRDRANPGEPHPPPSPERQPPPAWLSRPARRWWYRIRPTLVRMKLLTSADTVALGLLCDALAEYLAAREVVEREGATYWTTGKVEQLRERPEVGIASDAWRRAKLMLTEFGSTPASRAKVSAVGESPADPLAAWEQGTR